MDKMFTSSFEYKLIYIFEIRDEVHKGLLKIGDTTIQTEVSPDKLPANCKSLNQAAKQRIKQYTNTAGVSPELLHTELAIRIVKDKNGTSVLEAFRDHHVHKVLENSGIPKKKLKNSTSREWFEVDLQTVLNAIEAVKKCQYNLSNATSNNFTPIVFRPEQETAIEKTIKQFKAGNRMLWNAKMRFGKTLCALEVVRKSKFKKTIIITHRPVVDSGWYEDFKKVFRGMDNYIYGSKNSGYTVDQLLKLDKNFVYFASIQDLRGSDAVGGKFNKNDVAFSLNWDFVIVDEAHEGTTTALGNDVIKTIIKEDNGYGTKFLALSGTPFNILGDYDDNVYTWDYVMEQSSKREWDELHFGDSNPYDELPKLKIFTYDLGKIISDGRYVELEDKAFNFREFFRVWTGDMKVDRKPVPARQSKGDFFHANDVWNFLNLITKEDKDSQFPYATEEYRDLFRHSLWMVPGVKEAKALSKMMKSHPVFGSGVFDIVNVAGDGDEEEKSEDALKKVRDAIGNAGDFGYTITLSCGKLTTGVTVPEWTAVFMLSGSFSTSAANYLQTIFRVQSPCNKNGKIKQSCYVFDFAPDRTLKMVAESVAISTKAGKADESDRRIMGEFLNYCPVIAVDGTVMKKYDTNRLLQQLKRAYAERAVQNGFDDNNLYNDQLLKLNDIDLDKFNKLKGIVGLSKAALNSKDVEINKQGFTDEEYEEIKRIEKKPKKERSPEEDALIKEKAEKNKQAANARSILRGISIRMPLLIYGADINIDEDITMQKLVDIVDDSSWEEFMPVGVTKNIFKDFIKYYDSEIFIAAGRKIRNTVKNADELPPTERVQKITALFSCFKNPDKETVLTPWRVVNMHMGDCLGGYDFYNTEHNELENEPRYLDRGKVTADTVSNLDAKILEINSKTGLYPLYITYSIFKSKCAIYSDDALNNELQEKLWTDTVQNNIYVICKTRMAKSITTRTLVGFKNILVNAHYFDDLVKTLENKPKNFVRKVLNAGYWNKKGEREMKFNAVVGNPPYQINDGGSGRGMSAKPLYNAFVEQSKKLNTDYVSMITPSRWFAGGKGLDEFRANMLSDNHIKRIIDYANSSDCFPGINIAGGVNYFLWDKNHSGQCVVTSKRGHSELTMERVLDEYDIFIRNNASLSIIRRVESSHDMKMDLVVYSRNVFGIESKEHGSGVKDDKNTLRLIHSQKGNSIGTSYISKNKVLKNTELIDKYKVMIGKVVPRNGEVGIDPSIGYRAITTVHVLSPQDVFTETYLLLAAFDTLNEAENFAKYMTLKLPRFLLHETYSSMNITKANFRFVPFLDYSKEWTDGELYKRYDCSKEEIEMIESMIRPLEYVID